ncbi:hypothetical protein [Paraglaciecola aestuariivivens]
MQKINRVKKSLVLASVLLAPHALSTEMDLGYDSRYVSEGRNNLAGEGITWLQLSHQVNSTFSVVSLYGVSDVYDEFNLGLVYANSFKQIDYYVSYTHLSFFKDDQTDNEIGFGLGYGPLDWLNLALDTTYSVEAEGAFVEVSANSSYAITPYLSLNPYLKFGFDYGYASDTHRGYNHTAVGSMLSYQHSDKLGLNLILEHNRLSSSVQGLTQQKNNNWAGLHLVYQY